MTTIKFALSLDQEVHHAFAQLAGREGRTPTDVMRDVLTDHALASGDMRPDGQTKMERYRSLSRRAAEAALDLVERDGFSDDVTLRTVRALEADDRWMEEYARHVGGDPKARGNPEKNNLNQNIGFRIKQALGAEVLRTPEGKPSKSSVSDSIIQSFTRLRRL